MVVIFYKTAKNGLYYLHDGNRKNLGEPVIPAIHTC